MWRTRVANWAAVVVLALAAGVAHGGLVDYQALVSGEPSLISYYTFDGDTTSVSDAKGGNHGTLVGTTAWGPGVGGSGQSLSLGGAGHVNLGVVPALEFPDGTGTVEAWVRSTWTTKPGYNPAIVAARDGGPVRYSIHMERGRNKLQQWTGTYREYVTRLYPDQWDHVVAVYGGGTCTMYRNGMLIPPVQSLPLGSTGHGTQIGSADSDSDGQERWIGEIDEVAFYDDPLDAATVEAHYRAMLGQPTTPPSGVVGWWRMEDGSGATAADLSGNGYYGLLRNFADTSAGGGNTTQSGWANALISPTITDRGHTLPNAGSVRLDGSNDFVQTTAPIPTGSFTVEAIASHENAGATWSPLFGESTASGNTGIFFLGKRHGSGILHYNVYNTGGGHWTADVSAPGMNIADGNPHHVAMTFDDARDALVVYYDYKPVHVLRNIPQLPNPYPGSQLRLGSRDDTHAGEKWDGRIDEARLWNQAVLPTQMLNSPYGTVRGAGYALSDDFTVAGPDWAYFQNTGTNNVGIIPEPGNPGNNVLQLCPAANGLATSAILQQPLLVGTFSLQFRFRIPAGTGADGFTVGIFDVPYHLGGTGGALGYYDTALAGRFPSFVVEFDTYQGGTPGETNENHVAVQMNYDFNSFIGPSPSAFVPDFDLENGQWTYCRMLFDNGTISVWLNQVGFDFTPADLLINSQYVGDVDLSGNGLFDPFVGYLGLTAGTGGLNDQVIIDDLTLEIIPEPTSLALLGLGMLTLRLRRRR